MSRSLFPKFNESFSIKGKKSMGKQIVLLLIIIHIIILCFSNILVQYPIVIFDLQTTWGAFSYPLIFILTDLTTRLMDANKARKIIYLAMIPGLISSLLISNWWVYGQIWVYNMLALRIALASFIAYVVGQLIDIFFFQRLRQQGKWWVAPTIATIFGNVLDTYSFFFIAFYHSSTPFLRVHWLEIASVDLTFKLLISLVSFVPIYGLILNWVLLNRSKMTWGT